MNQLLKFKRLQKKLAHVVLKSFQILKVGTKLLKILTMFSYDRNTIRRRVEITSIKFKKTYR